MCCLGPCQWRHPGQWVLLMSCDGAQQSTVKEEHALKKYNQLFTLVSPPGLLQAAMQKLPWYKTKSMHDTTLCSGVLCRANHQKEIGLAIRTQRRICGIILHRPPPCSPPTEHKA